jgi:GAF domain-containing protein
VEEKIERILNDIWRRYAGALSVAEIFKDVAAEIAKLYSTELEAVELTWVDKVEELTDAWHSRLARNEAQLAEMQVLLSQAVGLMAAHSYYEWVERAQKALTAAPEVLWAGEETKK